MPSTPSETSSDVEVEVASTPSEPETQTGTPSEPSATPVEPEQPIDASTPSEATEGEAPVDDATVGEATVGEATIGEATVGEATIGEATMGEATPGEAVEYDVWTLDPYLNDGTRITGDLDFILAALYGLEGEFEVYIVSEDVLTAKGYLVEDIENIKMLPDPETYFDEQKEYTIHLSNEDPAGGEPVDDTYIYLYVWIEITDKTVAPPVTPEEALVWMRDSEDPSRAITGSLESVLKAAFERGGESTLYLKTANVLSADGFSTSMHSSITFMPDSVVFGMMNT